MSESCQVPGGNKPHPSGRVQAFHGFGPGSARPSEGHEVHSFLALRFQLRHDQHCTFQIGEAMKVRGSPTSASVCIARYLNRSASQAVRLPTFCGQVPLGLPYACMTQKKTQWHTRVNTQRVREVGRFLLTCSQHEQCKAIFAEEEAIWAKTAVKTN